MKENKLQYDTFDLLPYEDQVRLFDAKFISLEKSGFLSHDEYIKHRDFQIYSGLFYFRLTQFSYQSDTKINLSLF